MRHRSKKKEAEYRLRRPLVARLLKERPLCEACPVFAAHDVVVVYVQRSSQDVHEIVRRSQGGSILDEDNLMVVCRPCHQRIGNHPQLAFELGLARHGWERDS
jgi:5-methylcytosine-specific restriction endonuclease McrA